MVKKIIKKIKVKITATLVEEILDFRAISIRNWLGIKTFYFQGSLGL
jgi:hypothetical protein